MSRARTDPVMCFQVPLLLCSCGLVLAASHQAHTAHAPKEGLGASCGPIGAVTNKRFSHNANHNCRMLGIATVEPKNTL